jgi:hypothetical protein
MDRKTWIALGILFAATWIAMWMMFLFEAQMRAFYFLGLWLLTWIPGCLAIICSLMEKLEIPFPAGRFRFYLSACLLAWILGIYIGYNPAHQEGSWFLDLFFVYPLFSLLFNGISAFGSSLFWWGYLYKKLEKWHPLLTLLLIGTLSGLWCTPLVLLGNGYYFDNHRIAGLVMLPVFHIAISPMMFYFRYKTGSMLAPALFFALLEGSYCLCAQDYPAHFLSDGPISIPGLKILSVCSCVTLGFLGWQGVLFRQKSRPPISSKDTT